MDSNSASEMPNPFGSIIFALIKSIILGHNWMQNTCLQACEIIVKYSAMNSAIDKYLEMLSESWIKRYIILYYPTGIGPAKVVQSLTYVNMNSSGEAVKLYENLESSVDLA